MKKSLIILTATVLVGGTTIVSCKSNSDKKEDAVEKVADANENLNEVKTEIVDDAILKANDAEWQTFKTEANKTITSNEDRIADLKKAIKKPGTTFDAAFLKSIATMEDKNNSLKTKITDYENNQTDWESFKREFNSDMNDIGKSLKNLTVNNKK